ncbi:MAG: hypothetical protein SGBAC_010661 [Bacillariaceae sp.]
MTSFTYSGEGEEQVPNETENLVVAEAVQALRLGFCSHQIHLKAVVFSSSSGVQSIPNNAFSHCLALKDVEIPSTVKAIGDFAFHRCASLTEVEFPKGLDTIGINSFSACGFTHLSIPGSLSVIEESAFAGCMSLLDLELFNGLKVIGQDAFSLCSNLRHIDWFPSTVEVIGACAFSECNSLEAADLPKGLKKIGEYAFSCASMLDSVAIPSSVEHIEENAFSGCRRLEVLRLEPGLKTIGAGAFCQCPKLLRVSIPETVNKIGDNAFASCTSLRDVGFVGRGGSLRLIGASAFAFCRGLHSCYIPYSVVHVGDMAFLQSGLISVEIPEDSSTTFGWNVFRECHRLTNIVLPSSSSGDALYDEVYNDEIFDGCRVLDNAYGPRNVIQGIKSRFHGYPVHEACYYAASVGDSTFKLTRTLKLQGATHVNLRENLVDQLGMTPFHVLMSASKKRPALLKVLLEAYPSNVLGFTCPNGDTALDYLVMNWTTEASAMLRMALHQWMIDGMQSWGSPQWRSKMLELVESVFNDNSQHKFRRDSALKEACKQMERYELMEATSLLEICLWKMKVQSMRSGAKRMAVDRESSRARCDATVIVPAVLDYLLDSDEESSYEGSSYEESMVEWEARKRKFPRSLVVSSLCFVESSDDSDSSEQEGSPLLLVGMTNGSLSIFQQTGQQNQSEEEVLQQQVTRGETNDQESSCGIKESSEWKLVGSHELCKGALSFLHVSKMSEKQSVVLVGGLNGLWCWNHVSDLLTEAKATTTTTTTKPIDSISIENAQATDSDVYISTAHRKLYRIGIASLIGSSGKKAAADWKEELPLPLVNKSDVGHFEITALHLTGTSLLVGSNQSKVHCWELQKQAYSEPLDLSTLSKNKSEGADTVRVTAITSIQPDWWTIAGTIVSDDSWTGRFPSKADRKRPLNFLGTWHGPSKSRTQLVSNIPETIQGLMVAASSQLYSIGNLNALTIWESPYKLERLHRIGTNAKCNKAICCMNGGLAVAGVGTKVDLVQSNVRLQSLDLLQTPKSDARGARETKN